METKNEHRGTCLCGAVRIVAKAKTNDICACHCKMCRRWGGGPFLSADCDSDASFDGAENISIFSSSDWAERGFCRICGTHLFYRLKQDGRYGIPVGLFNDSDRWRLTEQIFIDRKPLFFSFSERTRDLTEKEVFAEYS